MTRHSCLTLLVFLAVCQASFAGEATPVSSISVQDGFQVELLRSAQDGEDSWISMTFDDRGRIIVGLDSKGVARLTLGETVDFEKIEDSFRHCRGVLFAHNSLYVSATNSKGFYRLRDTNGDDQFDEVKLLAAMDYRSRYGHGTNQIKLGPDNMIYVVNGNDVAFPEATSPNSAYHNPQNDWLVPNPHDAGQDNRVGHILRTDPEGKKWEVIAGGFRNQVDVAFNADGELFTYDADMEWDAGLPWYRPTRVNHVVSGGEYGWRWGTGKWPPYYADSLPSTLDTGLGSPTGIEFGTDSNFPPSFQQKLFIADWQNGRILSVQMTPHGASYECTYDLFIEGGPLNVCDMTFGPDGCMYFITGGRGSQSGLYRVRYIGSAVSTSQPESTSQTSIATTARALRHELEFFHTHQDSRVIDLAWSQLGNADAWLRNAARVAIERQDVGTWRERALSEQDPTTAITALLALARVGSPNDQAQLLSSLAALPLERLSHDELLAALRVYALTFIRQGRPADATIHTIARRLDKMFPHTSSIVNQELCELLVYLEAATVLEKTLNLLDVASTQEEQIHYAMLLMHIKDGWSIDSRGQVLSWLKTAKRFPGGKLVDTAVKNLEQDLLASLSEQDRVQLADAIAALAQPLDEGPPLPPRPFVRHWTPDDLSAELPRAKSERSFADARVALRAAMCLRCHRIGNEGGRVGPDLTNIGKRFDDRALLESILEPSKVIDPKYRHTAYVLDNGKIVFGRPIGVNSKQLTIQTDPLSAVTVTIDRDAIEASQPAEVSPMPNGLADTLTTNEILDLLAYLRANGDPENDAFASQEGM
jgi:putative heme-binding domain-containing protein